jgi:hypothetical protein
MVRCSIIPAVVVWESIASPSAGARIGAADAEAKPRNRAADPARTSFIIFIFSV